MPDVAEVESSADYTPFSLVCQCVSRRQACRQRRLAPSFLALARRYVLRCNDMLIVDYSVRESFIPNCRHVGASAALGDLLASVAAMGL